MDYLVFVAGLVIALLLGAALAALFTGRKNSEVVARAEVLAEQKRQAEQTLAETRQQHDKTVADLKVQHDRAIADLKASHDRIVADLNTSHDKTVTDLKAQHDKTVTDLKSQHDKTVAEMKSQQAEVMAEQERRHAEALKAMREQHEEVVEGMQRRHDEAVKAMQERFAETMEKVTAQVKNATADMLKERQKEFAESSHQNLGQIVDPLRETIDKMKKAMDASTLKQTEIGQEMKTNIEHMMRQSQAAKESADELARVFKHQSKVQGDWGETVLAELLTAQGLTEGIHFDTQAVIRDAEGNTVRTAEGSMMRPDIILHLDQRRELIIDSKVSLTAFIDYVNAETEDERAACLRAHVTSVQRHVEELARKDYSSYIQAPKVKMDYVIMFVPHTAALWTALNAQPDLWRKAMERGVFIADEQTLFAALRIIHLTWTQILQAQNHEKVYDLANELLTRVGQFWTDYKAIGNALESANKAYEHGKTKITDGGQSINNTANKLIRLGAKQSAKHGIPQLEESESLELEIKN